MSVSSCISHIDNELHKMRTSRILLHFLINTAFGLAIASAQTGSVSGRILDQGTKEALPSAVIQIVGTQLGTAADIDGKFMIANIPVGTYEGQGIARRL